MYSNADRGDTKTSFFLNSHIQCIVCARSQVSHNYIIIISQIHTHTNTNNKIRFN